MTTKTTKTTKILAHALLALSMGLGLPLAQAAGKHGDKEIKEDIQRHRAMAAAHEGAAKCLESGKKYDACMKELQAACKGLGIGKQCGLRHEH